MINPSKWFINPSCTPTHGTQ